MDNEGDLNDKKFNNRPRPFQIYQTHYERDSHTPTVSSVTKRDDPVLSSPQSCDTDMSCIQLCKDPYHKLGPDDNDWTGDNCHDYCSPDMEACSHIGHLDLSLSAINTQSVYGQHDLSSPNGVVILFDEPDYTGVSIITWSPVDDLEYVGFNDRAKSLFVMPP